MRQSWSIERRAAVGFATAFLILTGVGIASFRSADRLTADAREEVRTFQALEQTDRLRALLKEVEAAGGDYLGTGDAESLRAYGAARHKVEHQLKNLAVVSSAHPRLRAGLARLASQIARSVPGLATFATLRRREAEPPASATAGRARWVSGLAPVLVAVRRIQAAERAQMPVRASAAQASLRDLKRNMISGSALTLLFVLLTNLILCHDMSERRRAEGAVRVSEGQLRSLNETLQRQVAERTTIAEHLSRSNAELERFATVASHDLQEPLRKIQTFGDRLQTRCGQALSADGRDYLERMQNAAGRMRTLIEDLLTLSRVSSRARAFAPVDLNEVVRGVLSDLEVRIEQCGARVEAGDLPVVDADEAQFRQLFLNLIGNALKFYRAGEPPVVRIDAARIAGTGEPGCPHGDWVQVAVADSGIGFDEQYLGRIFELFQRLHGRDEYDGTGVGLAVCRKIVERHGGSITARSTPGQGATFLVTIPDHQPRGTDGDESDCTDDHNSPGR